MRDRAAALIIALVAIWSSTPASAQCFVDDGFSGIPPCLLVTTNGLPAFPGDTIASEGACFRDCNLQATFPVTMNLGAPIPVFTDLYASVFSITGTVSTAPTFMLMKYARTWREFDPGTGTFTRQVWRFLVNADLPYITTTPAPCPVPDRAALGLSVHVVGSVDFGLDCSGSWETPLINLTHHCEAFSTASATIGNRDHTYAFVGPAPFLFNAPQPTPSGAFAIGDGARATDVNLTSGVWDTYSETPSVSGYANIVGNSCPCSSGTGALRWDDLDFQLDYGPDSLVPVPWPPFLPTGLSAFRLGRYAHPPGSFPSNQAISVYVGVAIGTDSCAGNIPIHFLNGVGTTGGNFVENPHLPLPIPEIFDLANSHVLTTTPPFKVIGTGALFVSTMVWSAGYL